MKFTVFLIVSLFSSFAFSQSKAEIKQMLEQFKSNGMFSEAQIKEAEKQLESLSEDDIKKIKAQADQKLADPQIQKKLQEMKMQNN